MTGRKIDANQREIVKCLRNLGVSVFIMSNMGRGCPDLLLSIFGITAIAEIKDGSKPPSAQKLTKAQKDFAANWKGDYYVIRSVEDAINLVSTLRMKSNVSKQMPPCPS